MSSPSLRIRHARIRRLLPAAIVAAATAMMLTGCEPGVLAPPESPEPSTSTTPTATDEPSETPGPTDEPVETEASETPQPTTPPVAGDLACSDIFTAAQLYDFNPNFAPTEQQGQLPGATATIADAGGTVCAYQHVTGDDRLVIAVLQNPGSTTAPAFETAGEVGVASTSTGSLLVSVASIYFPSAQDAQPVLDQVTANLG